MSFEVEGLTAKQNAAGEWDCIEDATGKVLLTRRKRQACLRNGRTTVRIREEEAKKNKERAKRKKAK